MIDCSKTENYLREKQRMCLSFDGCRKCNLSESNNYKGVGCGDFCGECPKEAIRIVQKWSDSHPQKTFLDDFKEKYPKALSGASIPHFCPKDLGFTQSINCGGDCKECWNRPLEEEQK